jgi:hypothetical protein
MPVFSTGGMRFQDSWKVGDPVSDENQRNLDATIRRAFELGVNHFETAHGYGTSEYQLGKILPQLPRDEIIVQTKVAPMDDAAQFENTLNRSMELLQLDYIDLFSFHGINDLACLERTQHCMDKALQWQREGRLRHIGFSTHGLCEDIIAAIETDAFAYVNIHWYYIFQENWPAIEAATKHDMGVFIISPNDKGGMLYKQTDKMAEATAPLHPMVFNGLFCLARPEVHTLSCGVSCPEDFDIHMETVEKLERAEEEIAPLVKRVETVQEEALGPQWHRTWREGVPEWRDTPGEVNIPWILRLRNLAVAFDMLEYGKMRYNLLGNGGHWFPGNNAEKVPELDLSECLADSPNRDVIPGVLMEAHEMLRGEERKRLQED